MAFTSVKAWVAVNQGFRLLTMVMGKNKQVKSCQLLSQVVIAAAVLPSAVSDEHKGPKWSIKV